MQGGGPSHPTYNKQGKRVVKRPAAKAGPPQTNTGWDDVAAAKNEVFADDEDDQNAASGTGGGSGWNNTFSSAQ